VQITRWTPESGGAIRRIPGEDLGTTVAEATLMRQEIHATGNDWFSRMGTNMTLWLIEAGHECLVYDAQEQAVQGLVKRGAKGSSSLGELVQALSRPRVVWLTVPSAVEGRVLNDLVPLLETGESRSTLHAAVDEGVSAPVISSTLFARFSSRGNEDFASRLLSAMRCEFGGHVEKPPSGKGDH
jgi:6-phosphogluconate dehydrogenase (decarboxylating)